MSKVQSELRWPEQDVRKLFRQMERGIRELGMHEVHALNAAGKQLVRALGTSTRVSAKYRDVEQVKGGSANIRLNGQKEYKVTGYFGRPKKYGSRTVFATSKMDAKKRRAVIRYRGLAKKTWGAVGKSFGNWEHNLSTAGYELSSVAANMASVDRGAGYVRMTNSLSYAVPALEGGPNAVDTAMIRAARGLQKSFDKQLERRLARKLKS